jgi:hypothetical protein
MLRAAEHHRSQLRADPINSISPERIKWNLEQIGGQYWPEARAGDVQMSEKRDSLHSTP